MSDFEQNFSLHNHSYYSDGENAIEEIVKEAEDCGLAFVGISDHLCLHPGKPGTMGEKDIERYVKRVREIDAKSITFDLMLSLSSVKISWYSTCVIFI